MEVLTSVNAWCVHHNTMKPEMFVNRQRYQHAQSRVDCVTIELWNENQSILLVGVTKLQTSAVALICTMHAWVMDERPSDFVIRNQSPFHHIIAIFGTYRNEILSHDENHVLFTGMTAVDSIKPEVIFPFTVNLLRYTMAFIGSGEFRVRDAACLEPSGLFAGARGRKQYRSYNVNIDFVQQTM
jgi:hypothetical protein